MQIPLPSAQQLPQTPIPHFMCRSSESWQSHPAFSASFFNSTSIGSGPQP